MSNDYLADLVEHLQTLAGNRGALRLARASFEVTRPKSKLMTSLQQELGLDLRSTQDALKAVQDVMVIPMHVARRANETLLTASDLQQIARQILAAVVDEDDATLATWVRESKNVRKVSDDLDAAKHVARSVEQEWLRRIAG